MSNPHRQISPAVHVLFIVRLMTIHSSFGYSARDRKWAKFGYQFSHEFCHVLSNYENLKANPNNWFHEAICELASVFTLRRMAERWPTHPPYPQLG